MRALDRKLLRDLLGMKGQAVAIALVVAASIAVLVSSMSTYRSLERTQRVYYERYRFAEVFARVKRAPESVAGDVRAITGVAQVETRAVADVSIEVAGLDEPAVGRLVSLPPPGRASLNAVYLRSGRMPEPGRPGEALVSEGFAVANQLAPGDHVAAVIHGRWQRLEITGVALSPEYIYLIRPGELFPDDRRFGVFWMTREEVAAALDLSGAFNDLALTLGPGGSEREIIARLDRLLAPYGGVGAQARENQISHRYISDEIRQLRGQAVFIPAIFLGVAAFLLQVVLSRLIATQRSQIAMLKAFGYPERRIGLHYLELMLCIALTGTLLGLGVGIWMGRGMTRLYQQFFRFPLLEFQLGTGELILAVLMSSGAAIVGGIGAVRRVMQLPPAVAMQPEPPPSFRPTIVERLGLARLLSVPGRMILRSVERRPWRAALSVLAMGLAVAILVLGRGQEDAVFSLIDLQFHRVQREDVTVNYVEPRDASALYEVARMPGVLAAEPFRTVPATLRFGPRHRDAAVLGLLRGGRLRQLVVGQAPDYRTAMLPPEGVVLTRQLAELLGLGRGDLLVLEVQEGRRPVRRVPVVELVDEPVGLSAYMELGALHRLMYEGSVASGAFLRVDPLYKQELYKRLKGRPGVLGVSVKLLALESFQDTFAKNLAIFRAVLILFATIITFGVVYNNARIALAERSRELASLRVLGFTRAEISFILLGEMALLVVLAIPVGSVLGYLLTSALVKGYETEFLRLSVVIHPASYAFAALVLVVAAALSALVVRRRLDHLDLVEVLKTRE
ncbi:MAG TPA: ABC transporter permease [Polyangia bacterium]|nr:ABC transporter permease [Polyangia bacterium]